MNIVIKALATLGLCGLLLLPASAIGDARLLDDHRFVTSEETFGKTKEEVEKEIGPAHSIGPCTVDTLIEKAPVTFVGEGWLYQVRFRAGGASLSICFIKGYSVSEQRFLGGMSEDGRESTVLSEVFDHRVLRKVIDGDPDRPDWVDPDAPNI